MSAPSGTVQQRSAMDSLKRGVFWNYGGTYFFYFAIWQLAFTFLPLWLRDEGMGTGAIGVVYTVIAVTALVLQPIYGYVQDRLGFKKHLFYLVVLCAAFMGPFFTFVFMPLIGFNEHLAAVVGGIFLSLCLNSGVGVVEAYNERASRANRFEYGHARLFGSLAGGTAALVGGFIWAANPNSIWWAGSLSAIVLGTLLFVARVPSEDDVKGSTTTDGTDAKGGTQEKISKAAIAVLLRDRNFIGFVILMFGTAALYDVFDQQFPNYFATFVTSGDAEVLFSRVVAVQIFAEAAFMVAAPFIINKIGARKGLMVFATILVVRVLGSAFFTHTSMLIAWRLLAAIEMPFLLVSVMKYITRMFDVRISATAYMLGFSFAKNVGVAVFAASFGASYEAIGFAKSYIVMAAIIVTVTVIARVLMADDRDRPAPGEPISETPASKLAPAGDSAGS
ncbi:oligosaccharide MFS transporter [Sanguibacter suaedae]|uniref:Oligosaccharide MFS transporter n=1 Tax=Sanguibacter suaedae TaxID=2795737 RepID=A0A934M9X6_9MICO|nr:oligosaccharide MFS transporter [Sanguibacter suaedae]MBI9113636.1 oligosaccharide MFS transporter [Sanguibacter suaedae]